MLSEESEPQVQPAVVLAITDNTDVGSWMALERFSYAVKISILWFSSLFCLLSYNFPTVSQQLILSWEGV